MNGKRRLPEDVEYELLYGPLCEDVKAELAKRGLPVEGYNLDSLGDDIAAVNRAIGNGEFERRPPVTRHGWISAIVDYRAASKPL